MRYEVGVLRYDQMLQELRAKVTIAATDDITVSWCCGTGKGS